MTIPNTAVILPPPKLGVAVVADNEVLDLMRDALSESAAIVSVPWDDEVTYNRHNAAFAAVGAIRKRIEEGRLDSTRPYRDHEAAINKAAKALLAILDSEVERVGRMIKDAQNESKRQHAIAVARQAELERQAQAEAERIRKLEEKRIADEHAAKVAAAKALYDAEVAEIARKNQEAAENARAAAAILDSADDTEAMPSFAPEPLPLPVFVEPEAPPVFTEPERTAVIVPQVEIPAALTSAVRSKPKKYRARIINAALVPIEFGGVVIRPPDMKVLDGLAKLNPALKCPGVEIYEEDAGGVTFSGRF